jgi:hypothetical protein
VSDAGSIHVCCVQVCCVQAFDDGKVASPSTEETDYHSRSVIMFFSDLLPQIDAKWHAAFVRFVETGDASDGFLNYLDADHRCQKVMERLLAARVRAMKPFMSALGMSPAAKTRKAVARKTTLSRGRASAERHKERPIAHR